ncbi:hypothetical protein [Rhodococcus sp. 05-2254-6]|uniref:hypothetical protein n=1 Tax=Rhodococcus sp. 05-2254-6 TaxID=2022489 RepID=UPI0015C6795B|nr:hypothetical protein [Rhodococcus sp. 05-2254-6]
MSKGRFGDVMVAVVRTEPGAVTQRIWGHNGYGPVAYSMGSAWNESARSSGDL